MELRLSSFMVFQQSHHFKQKIKPFLYTLPSRLQARIDTLGEHIRHERIMEQQAAIAAVLIEGN